MRLRVTYLNETLCLLVQAFVVVGDSNGHVGLGVKCAKEVRLNHHLPLGVLKGGPGCNILGVVCLARTHSAVASARRFSHCLICVAFLYAGICGVFALLSYNLATLTLYFKILGR